MVQTVNGVKNWASILDDNTRLQAEMLSRSEVVYGHVALMPDAHVGMGATVGSVIATKEAVIPAAIGVDIGCGMIAVRTGLRRDDLPNELGELHSNISRSVPSGIGTTGQWSSENKAYWEIAHRYRRWLEDNPPSDRLTDIEVKHGTLTARAALQVGTLGSGNHFVEMGLDGAGDVWVVIHSGSRGVGNQLAMHHINIARDICQEGRVYLEDKDLAHLTEGTEAFRDYIYDMDWAQRYALFNREIMMLSALYQVYRVARPGQVPETQRINCHHNFTQQETHFGEKVWLTRKGAIDAGESVMGVVPGSMATGIFITKGLGDPSSYRSSAHGAGRVRSRGAAKRELSLEGGDGLYSLMEGITWNVGNAQGLMDEHPLAYKDLDRVMEDQQDLCRPVQFLTPILNYKGS